MKMTSIPAIGPGHFPQVKRRLANAGRGVALNVTRMTKSKNFPIGHIPGGGAGLPYPTDDELDKSEVEGFIAPLSDAAGDAVSTNSEQYNPGEMIQVFFGALIWVEWGIVRYEDVFGKRHHLWFCHTWDGKSAQVANCPRGTNND